MRKTTIAILMCCLAGCASTQPGRDTYNEINAELNHAAKVSVQPAAPDAVAAALLPPIQFDVPKPTQPLEERFSVTFNSVPASQFFMAIVSGTRFNMLVHPDITGTISANLKDVTVLEALDAIRELYGYDYRVEGNRITVRPASLQTQVFQVNYLTGTRRGTSEIRVTSTSVADIGMTTTASAANGNTTMPAPGTSSGLGSRDSSKISTSSDSDFWIDLKAALDVIVGANREGRSVVISPQSGVVVVRAMTDEIRNVSAYLKATQLSVARQVILEAKILEVQLTDEHQTGINWAAFRSAAGSRASAGMVAPGTGLFTIGAGDVTTGATGIVASPGNALGAVSSAAGSLFGLAFQTGNFSALISFLESQGNVHVLSSPRIATMNNQKAVLKIGTDELFVTNVSTTTTTGTSTTTTPSVTLQPFFSGVVLDVTPQIDEQGNIMLHVRPSVSQVETVNKTIDLGTLGALRLPLPASNTSETDSIVRGRDGQIVAIGGLMRQASRSDRSQLPGAGDVPGIGALFRNTSQVSQKRELVILLKPTIVHDDAQWAQDVLESQKRMQRLAPRDDSYRW